MKFENDSMNANNEFYNDVNLYPIFRCLDLILDNTFIKNICKNKELDTTVRTNLLSIQFKAKMKFAQENKNYDLDGFPSLVSSHDNMSTDAPRSTLNEQTVSTNTSSSNVSSQSSNLISNPVSFADSSSQLFQHNNQILALTSMITSLQLELSKIKSNNNKVSFQSTANNTNNNISAKDESIELINNEINLLKIQFKNLYSKQKRFECHANYFKSYIKHKLVPPALFYNRFPMPFLPSNDDFVTEYNELIRKFQSDCLDLCLKHVENMIDNEL